MKPICTKHLDQDDAQTLVAQLRLHAAYLRGLLGTRTHATVPQAPTLAADDGPIVHIGVLTAHVTELEKLLGASAPAFIVNVADKPHDQKDSPGDKEQKNCGECSGTGRCKTCNGTGVAPGSTARNSCQPCNGSGKCSACSGSGTAGNKSKAYDPDAAILKSAGVTNLDELAAKRQQRCGGDD